MSSETAQRYREDLKAEYLLIQGQYEAFDQRSLALKSVVTPLLGAGLAFGYEKAFLWLIAVTTIAALSLWVLETIWKSFQSCLVRRIVALEKWFGEDDPPTMYPFQIYKAWIESWVYGKQLGVLWRIFRTPFIAIPYVVIVGAGLAAVVLRLTVHKP